jgi:hypothetical protein
MHTVAPGFSVIEEIAPDKRAGIRVSSNENVTVARVQTTTR